MLPVEGLTTVKTSMEMTANAASASPLIVARDLAMSFGTQQLALHGVSCDVREGEFVALLGPSGCGKSTFLRLIAGLMHYTSGTLTVAGALPEDARRSTQRVAFVFQEPNLLPWRTVATNIGLPLELRGASAGERARRVQDSLALIGLKPEDARKRPRNLSGGMRMRVSLARALVTQPDVLLLDEPFAALDDVLRQQLNEELVRIWLARQWTGLFVTHNVAEAVFLSQRVLVMSHRPGSIVADVRVPFDYPREPVLRAAPEFARLCGELSSRLREFAS
jgi:NitT/TauT family transport system ATP-binding protein